MCGGIVYPLGRALVRFLAARYGEWRIVQMYDDEWKYRSFARPGAGRVRQVAGAALRRMAVQHAAALLPLLRQQRPLALDSRPSRPWPSSRRYGRRPAIRCRASSTFRRAPGTPTSKVRRSGGHTSTVVKGERSAEFESFHEFDSRFDVSSAGVVVFASKFQDRDALLFWSIDPANRGPLPVPGHGVHSLAVVVAGREEVVFSGLAVSGFSDLYLLHLDTGELDRLTADRYQDLDPSFSPDGPRIVFASDRTPFGATGGRTCSSSTSPAGRPLPDVRRLEGREAALVARGRITFASDRRGAFDVYRVDSTGTGRRETAVPGGCSTRSGCPPRAGTWSRGSRTSRSASTRSCGARLPTPTPWCWPPPARRRRGHGPAGRQRDGARRGGRYTEHYTLDFAAGGATYSPGYVSAQGATFLMSDMLGDHWSSSRSCRSRRATARRLGQQRQRQPLFTSTSRAASTGAWASFGARLLLTGDLDEATRSRPPAGSCRCAIRCRGSREWRGSSGSPSRTGRATSFRPARSPWVPAPPRHDRDELLHVRPRQHPLAPRRADRRLPRGPHRGGDDRLSERPARQLAARGTCAATSAPGCRRRWRCGPMRTTPAARSRAGEHRRIVGAAGYPEFSYVAGAQVLMGNVEWRFPITDYLSFGFPIGEMRLPGVQGALFADLGRVWSGDDDRGVARRLRTRACGCPVGAADAAAGHRLAVRDRERRPVLLAAGLPEGRGFAASGSASITDLVAVAARISIACGPAARFRICRGGLSSASPRVPAPAPSCPWGHSSRPAWSGSGRWPRTVPAPARSCSRSGGASTRAT